MKPISDALDQLIWLSQLAFSVSLALASISVCIATDDFSSCHRTCHRRRWGAAPPLDDVGETDHGKISTANGGLYGSIAWLRRRWCRGHQMKHLETKFLSHGIKCLWNKRDSSRQPRVLHSFHMKMFKFLAHANSMHDRWVTPVMLMIHFLWPQFSSLPNYFIVYFKNQN